MILLYIVHTVVCSQAEVMLNSEKIKPVALAINEIHLSEDISQLVGRSVGPPVRPSVSQ